MRWNSLDKILDYTLSIQTGTQKLDAALGPAAGNPDGFAGTSPVESFPPNGYVLSAVRGRTACRPSDPFANAADFLHLDAGGAL